MLIFFLFEIVSERRVYTGAVVSIHSCIFYRCEAKSLHTSSCGGAVFATDCSVHITSTMFRQNYAADSGGAIRLEECAMSAVNSTVFHENRARAYSGSVSSFNVMDSVFSSVNITDSTAHMAESCFFLLQTSLGIRYCNNIGSIIFFFSTVSIKDSFFSGDIKFTNRTNCIATESTFLSRISIDSSNVLFTDCFFNQTNTGLQTNCTILGIITIPAISVAPIAPLVTEKTVEHRTSETIKSIDQPKGANQGLAFVLLVTTIAFTIYYKLSKKEVTTEMEPFLPHKSLK